MGNQYIDFNHVKSNADVRAVLEALDIECIKQSGDELRIHCVQPDHEDNRASCDVNTKNKAFFCHSCKAHGSILDLVAAHQGCDLREASQEVADICNIPVSSRSHPQAHGKKHRAAKAEKDEPLPSQSPEPEAAEQVLFKPFTTVLKLDTEHKFATDRGFTPEQIEQFGMGYQDRGMLKGRWCVPIHDIKGNQLGYTGRYAKKQIPKDVEKWLLPPAFPKQDVLFNAHRIQPLLNDAGVVLVEGPFDVMRLHALNIPSLGLLGTSISDEQIRIMIDEFDIELVILMMDGDAPGRKAVSGLLERLSRDFFVRDVKLPDGHDPETAAQDFLLEAVWGVV